MLVLFLPPWWSSIQENKIHLYLFKGHLQHKGDKVKFSSRFGQGSIIGVHLDTWHGTLTFYKNRHCIGACLSVTRAGFVRYMKQNSLMSLLSCCNRCCRYEAAEQKVLPHGELHSSQKQYEGDPCLLRTHLPEVPLLCPAPTDVAQLPRRTEHCRAAARPAQPPPDTAGLGLHPQQQQQQAWRLRAAQGPARGLPGGDEPALEPQPQPHPEPGVHPECLRFPEPLHQSTSWHCLVPVLLSNVTMRLPLPSDSPQQRLRQLLLRARGPPMQKMPLDMTPQSECICECLAHRYSTAAIQISRRWQEQSHHVANISQSTF